MKYLLILLTLFCGKFARAGQLGQSEERALIAYMQVKPGTEPAFLNLAQTVIAKSRREPGNVTYQLHQSVTNPQLFVFYELYETQADLQNHRNSAHVTDFLNATKSITVKFFLEDYAPLDELNQDQTTTGDAKPTSLTAAALPTAHRPAFRAFADRNLGCTADHDCGNSCTADQGDRGAYICSH